MFTENRVFRKPNLTNKTGTALVFERKQILGEKGEGWQEPGRRRR